MMLVPERLPRGFRLIHVSILEIPSHTAPRVSHHCRLDLVQQGISEKVALVANFLSAFVTGFALAYGRSWRLALAMSSILPCIAITGGIMNKFISTYMQYVPSIAPKL